MFVLKTGYNILIWHQSQWVEQLQNFHLLFEDDVLFIWQQLRPLWCCKLGATWRCHHFSYVLHVGHGTMAKEKVQRFRSMRGAWEVDQRPGRQTRQVSKTFLQCDGTISCKLVMFYYTTSPYPWKNYVHLTGMITVLSPVYSFNFLEMCSKFSEVLLH